MNALHVIKFPNGRFGYVGAVPVDILYVDSATKEQIENAKFGATFGPKTRIFTSREEAVAFAEERGYEVSKAS